MKTINKPVNDVNGDEMWAVDMMTPRIKKLVKEWEDAPVVVCPESSFSFTKSYKQTEGLPETLRFAKAFAAILEETPLLIRDGELIVGHLTKHIRGADVLAAECPKQVLYAIDSGSFDRKMSEWKAAEISKEDVQRLKEDAEYWLPKLPPNYVNAALIEELGPEHMDMLMDRALILEGIPLRADTEMGIWGPTFPERIGRGNTLYRSKAMHIGLNAVIRKAKDELQRMEEEGYYINPATKRPTPYEKKTLLKAMIISCEAVINWAHRYADLARGMAAKESDPVRKAELERIAANCDWVPANPPRDFWECVQSIRFLHAAGQKEKPFRKDTTLGRLDQDLYPYYIADIESGKITREQAGEILGCLWLKVREGESYDPERSDVRHSQGTLLPNVTICGQDEQGRDVTNEVSYLILRVMASLKFSEPTVYVRVHEGMTDDFLRFAVKANLEHRGGCPAFVNDKLGTERYLNRGVSLRDAIDWNCSGCLAYHLDCGEHTGGFMHFNMTKIFELTLNDGFDPRMKKQLGPHTGDVTRMSLEEIEEAFYKQLDFFADQLNRDYAIRRSLEIAFPLESGFNAAMYFDTAIPYGTIPTRGGTPYSILTSMWVGERGTSDVADSLAALKQLVFDQKKVTMEEMMKALRGGWQGYEDLRQLCLRAPKYGNDDPYVDDIFVRVAKNIKEILQKRPDPITGDKVFLFKGAASAHMVHGSVVGALPNGRLPGAPANDGGVSAMAGMDVNGPTALINSASKFDMRQYVGGVLNMKFTKELLDKPEKQDNVAALIRTYMARGGWHIQFNIHSQEELIEARKHPEKYKNLLVRVGGYSANFVDLPLSLQDEIINRTPHAV
jgi:formate C-acetyltransferase